MQRMLCYIRQGDSKHERFNLVRFLSLVIYFFFNVELFVVLSKKVESKTLTTLHTCMTDDLSYTRPSNKSFVS